MSKRSIKYKPITKPLRVDFNLSFTQEEFDTLKKGHEALDMGDKWNMLYQEGKLFLIRSWTGSCIFELELKKEDNGTYSSDHFLVETNTDIYRRRSDADDKSLLNDLLEWLINIDEETE